MDLRYSQNKGASTRPQLRAEALTRAKLAQARVQGRSMRGEERYTSAMSGTNGYAMGALITGARAADRLEGDRQFLLEGSGVYGAAPSSEDARRDARLGRGKLDLYA